MYIVRQYTILYAAGLDKLCQENHPVSWKAAEPRSDRENSWELSVQEHETEQDVQLFSGPRGVHGSKEIRVSQER